MREIKFRYRYELSDGRVERNTFGLDDIAYGMIKNVQHGYEVDGSGEPNGIHVKAIRYEGEFTGLLDKNGVEIFEGDIVTYSYVEGCNAEEHYRESSNIETITATVKFERASFFPVEGYVEVEDCFYSRRFFDFEVIGNIYENPELLKP